MGIAVAKSNDPPEVRNWTIHWIAIVLSMAALGCKCSFLRTICWIVKDADW